MIGLTGLATVQADMKAERATPLPAHKSVTAKQSTASDIYIVQMKGNPLISYEGDLQGFAATKPAKGQKLNHKSSNVKKYSASP